MDKSGKKRTQCVRFTPSCETRRLAKLITNLDPHMQPTNKPRFITAHDAARCIGITKSTVYDWIAKGSIPCYRMGRIIRISTADLEAYLAASRMNTLATPKILAAQEEYGIDPDRVQVDDPGTHLGRPGHYAQPTSSQAPS